MDFSRLNEELKARYIDSGKVLNEVNKQFIQQISSIYDLTDGEILKVFFWGLDEDGSLNKGEIADAAKEMYELKTGNKMTKEDYLIRTLEVITPAQLIDDLRGEDMISDKDASDIKDFVQGWVFKDYVTNVFIHYVYLVSDRGDLFNGLKQAYGNWKKADLKTARDAFYFAKEYSKYSHK